jgi:hypothetical protein
VTGWKKLAAAAMRGTHSQCTASFAVTTFMPSMLTAGLVSKGKAPAAFSIAFLPGKPAAQEGGFRLHPPAAAGERLA